MAVNDRNTGWRDILIGALVAFLVGIAVDAKILVTPALSEERVRSISAEQLVSAKNDIVELKQEVHDLTAAISALDLKVTDLNATLRTKGLTR